MPLPLAANAADIPTDVCCTTFWEMGERIRSVAFAAVCACIEPDCTHPNMRSWQTEGTRTLDVMGDSLVVTFVRAAGRGDTRTRVGNMRPNPVTRAEFRVELRENGWPMIREHSATESIKLPDYQVVNAVAKHARGHAEKMWRALLSGATHTAQARQLFPSLTNPHILHRGVSVGDIVPIGPSGPQIAYGVTVTVDHTLP